MTTMQKEDLKLNLQSPPLSAEFTPEERGLARDEVKLLVLAKESGQVSHASFRDLPNYLQEGDVLVVNTSATIPGALSAVGRSGEFTIHLATRLSEREFIIERRTVGGSADATPFSIGERIVIQDRSLGKPVAHAIVKRRFHPNSRLWHVVASVDLFSLASTCGIPIRYGYVRNRHDVSAYQTIFAKDIGSAEMPSAARPFSHRVLQDVTKHGVQILSLVLHTGVSSHEVETDLDHHPVLPEWYHIPDFTARKVNEAKAAGRRVIAVGTTVVRALESAARADGTVKPTSEWTTHLVTPSTPPKVTTGLVTGFHESQTSHLAMMFSFTKKEYLENAYNEAIERQYLWHEFGDSNLIL